MACPVCQLLLMSVLLIVIVTSVSKIIICEMNCAQQITQKSENLVDFIFSDPQKWKKRITENLFLSFQNKLISNFFHDSMHNVFFSNVFN